MTRCTRPCPLPRTAATAAVAFVLSSFCIAPAFAQSGTAATPPPSDRAQTREHGTRVVVDPAVVRVDDGDTIDITWGENDVETIRILGIDTPETQHVSHNIPYAQAFGNEARGFAMGAFATASTIEVLRTPSMDPFGRTLGYVFIDGSNYSVLVVKARLAVETVSHYGDNGFPAEAAEVLAAAKGTGPVAFEPPHVFRRRMRDVAEWMKAQGIYPAE